MFYIDDGGYIDFLSKKCEPADLKKVTELEKSWRNADKVHQLEKMKKFPDRFPGNINSIGIEIMGKAIKEENPKTGKTEFFYEDINNLQNDALGWLIKELTRMLKVSMDEIYRHPEIGRKNNTEASTAKW